MRRRTYLAGLSGGVTMLGGCTGACGCEPVGGPTVEYESKFVPWERAMGSVTATPTQTRESDGVIEITKGSGDAVDPTLLFIEGDRLYPRGDGTWASQRTGFSGDAIWGEVSYIKGNATIYVDADRDWRLELVWRPDNGDEETKVLHANPPETDTPRG